MNKSEEALNLFSQGFNCAQAILAVFGDEFGLDKEAALKMACGFIFGARPNLTMIIPTPVA
ncbi:MAG: hypothetical protein PWP16_1161 [Eubacteriaceae bacterium]|jgi:hypothetical protein|nr:hypothetical protein [Eubacteriaceae bacterium]MDK2935874.1 hypothetical protein [Eubacteriaceae bacterium]MDN5307798.1 hypothetical protein [Eubacteriaceae bacterium]